MVDMTGISLDVIRHLIPQLNKAIALEPITRGLSADGKIIIHLPNHEKRLLRLFDITELAHKQIEYDALRIIEGYEVRCSLALACGILDGYKIGYMLLTFIEGEDARDELPKLTETEQYQVGLETGKELHKLHQLQAPSHITPWYDRKIAAHQKCIQEYKRLNLKFNDDSRILAFIEDHAWLMKARSPVFQHDDIHAGNVIIKQQKFAGLIDFNRYNWGDPVHDFLKMGMFSRELSVPFSTGQINGYHNSLAPDELFWELYALYLAISLFDSMVFVKNEEPENLLTLIGKLALIVDDHRGFELYKPTWYKANSQA